MDNTPKSCQNSADSGCVFDSSRSMFESTPNTENDGTPVTLGLSRKRKASYIEYRNARKLSEVIESYPLTPKFSSTLNESLMNNLKKFNLQNDDSFADQQKELGSFVETDENVFSSRKIFSSNKVNKKFSSAPNTPEKQIKLSRDIGKKANTNSFIKNLTQINTQSPLNKEAYNILYPDLPSLEPSKKTITPLKFRDCLDKAVIPAKKCLFSLSHKDLLRNIINNNIIMNKIFKELSNGDLYRLAQVSTSLKNAILLDLESSSRYMAYMHFHQTQKENYRITPPSSPEKDERYIDVSPLRKNFLELAGILNKNQSLVKCPSCYKPSIVENFIGQCQDINSCGYIFCKKCNSFAYSPKDFKDKCNNAQLNMSQSRNHFGDISNSTVTSDYMTDSANSFFSSSFLNLNMSSIRYDSSGIFSERENSTPKHNAKRNLTKSFVLSSDVKVFSNNNNRTTPQTQKNQRRVSLLPVLPLENGKKMNEIIEPSSPPRIKQHAVCSKQSKKNLKRLTR